MSEKTLITTVSMSELKTILASGKKVEVNSKDGWVPIKKFVDKGVKDILHIKTLKKSVRCTGNHKIQLPDESWSYAINLRVGDNILTKNGEETIDSLLWEKSEPVCDIEVDHPNHRFYANGISVHNCQDTTQLQQDLITLLSEGNYLCIIGDLLQSIYGWLNATPENFSMEYMQNFFKQVSELTLVNNYRSPKNIVNIGNIIRANAGDPIKSIAKKEAVAGAVKFVQVRSNIQEGTAVVKFIKEAISKGYEPKDIAVLTRSSYYAKHTLEPALVRANLPYIMVARNTGKRLSEKPLNLLYFSALSLLINPNDIYSLGVLASQINGIGEAYITKLRKDFNANSFRLPTDYTGANSSKLDSIVELKSAIACLGELTYGRDSKILIDELTLTLQSFFRYTSLFSKDKDIQVIERSLLHWFNHYLADGMPNLQDVIRTVLTELDNFDEDEEENLVKLQTIHSFKGLESPVVIVAGFNSIREVSDPYNEEANVLYVQFTRAQELMYVVDSLTYITADNRTIYPKKNLHFVKLMKTING